VKWWIFWMRTGSWGRGNRMANAIGQLGHRAQQVVQQWGNMAVFAVAIGAAVATPPLRVRSFVHELYKLGALSLIIIGACGVTVGMVLGLQGYHTLQRFGAQSSLGEMVGLSLIRELGPVLTALLVTGRAGSATAAEIGTMVATEQLDGLRMLSIDPVRLVVMPRAVAMVVVMPLLTAIFILCGLYGGYIVGVGLMGGDPGLYMASLRSAVDFRTDVAGSLIKAVVFGLSIGLIATYRGYNSRPNSEGVSAATTSTVVIGSVTVLLADYVVTALWGV
jgi:phospholipid/cholesterol/gamma-HCH transport system permease protein